MVVLPPKATHLTDLQDCEVGEPAPGKRIGKGMIHVDLIGLSVPQRHG